MRDARDLVAGRREENILAGSGCAHFNSSKIVGGMRDLTEQVTFCGFNKAGSG